MGKPTCKGESKMNFELREGADWFHNHGNSGRFYKKASHKATRKNGQKKIASALDMIPAY